jgi:hypothetical protein
MIMPAHLPTALMLRARPRSLDYSGPGGPLFSAGSDGEIRAVSAETTSIRQISSNPGPQ